MAKLALNFICKDEHLTIERMLESVKTITDLIVANDTGSSDGTQELIRNFGVKNNIPTYVFERPFDDFGSSRDFALQQLKGVASDLGWDLETAWGYWIDGDEDLIIQPSFDKNRLDKDSYIVAGAHRADASTKFIRDTFFRLSKDFYWDGPVHESLKCREGSISFGSMEDLFVLTGRDASSRDKEKFSQKYVKYATMLEAFIQKGNRDSRWIYYTADSYDQAGKHCQDSLTRQKYLELAIKYYAERVEQTDGDPEQRYYAQFKLAIISLRLGYNWPGIESALLKAYELDHLRGESFRPIIQYYMASKNWEEAYRYSSFALDHFHGNNPRDTRYLFVQESLYNWQFLFMHFLVCVNYHKIDEAKAHYKALSGLINEKRGLFTSEEIKQIESCQALPDK